MTSEKAIARWARADQRMSKRWHPLGLLHDAVDGASRRRSAKKWEAEENRRGNRRVD